MSVYLTQYILSIDQVTGSVMFESEIKQNNSVYFGLTNTAYTVTLYRGTI